MKILRIIYGQPCTRKALKTGIIYSKQRWHCIFGIALQYLKQWLTVTDLSTKQLVNIINHGSTEVLTTKPSLAAMSTFGLICVFNLFRFTFCLVSYSVCSPRPARKLGPLVPVFQTTLDVNIVLVGKYLPCIVSLKLSSFSKARPEALL